MLRLAQILVTFSAVSHAPLCGLQVVDQELAAVPHHDGDAEEAAVLGAAMEELPGGAGRQLADLAGLRQGGVLQGQPHRSLCTTAIHLQGGREQKQSLPAVRGLLYLPPGLKVLIKPVFWMLDVCTGRGCLTLFFGRDVRFFFFFYRFGQSNSQSRDVGENSLAILMTYLNTGGRHLRRLVVDPESVPARRQRVVTDQFLDGRVLDLCGVEVDAAIGIAQSPMASWVTLWSWDEENKDNKDGVKLLSTKRKFSRCYSVLKFKKQKKIRH